MIGLPSNYLFQTSEGGWRIVGTRVSLDSIVQAYWDGHSPEQILALFPSLTLEKINGAITFYLHNRKEIDTYLAAQAARRETLRSQSDLRNAELLNRLEKPASPSAT